MNGVSGMGLSIRGSYLIGKIRESCGICGKLSLLYVREPEIQFRHFPVLHIMSKLRVFEVASNDKASFRLCYMTYHAFLTDQGCLRFPSEHKCVHKLKFNGVAYIELFFIRCIERDFKGDSVLTNLLYITFDFCITTSGIYKCREMVFNL